MDSGAWDLVARRRRGAFSAAAAVIVAFAVAGCDNAAPSVVPSPSAPPSAAVGRPAIQLDQEWTALNGEWTFSGQVDPHDDPTDVLLEIGPGPVTARVFDHQVAVQEGVTAPTPLTVTTREIPEIKEICVRFRATNAGGTSTTTPLCFPHDVPSVPPPAKPTVEVDPHWTVADGTWTFTGRIDPNRSPADVVLEVGRGPATAPKFVIRVPVQTGLAEVASVTVSTDKIPDTANACIRFTATNELGTVSSKALCFDPHAPPG